MYEYLLVAYSYSTVRYPAPCLQSKKAAAYNIQYCTGTVALQYSTVGKLGSIIIKGIQPAGTPHQVLCAGAGQL